MSFIASEYEKLELAVVNALAPLKSLEVVVTDFPETESDNKDPGSQPRVTVCYHSFAESDQLSNYITLAEHPVFVQVTFEAKLRKGPLGIYDLMRLSAPLLTGLLVPGFKPFTIGKFEMADREKGVWKYHLIIKTASVNEQVITRTFAYDSLQTPE